MTPSNYNQNNRVNRTNPADKREVIIDCLELERKGFPEASSSPKRRMKSGIIRHPYEHWVRMTDGQISFTHRNDTNIITEQEACLLKTLLWSKLPETALNNLTT